MEQTTVTIQIEEAVKNKFDALCKDWGLSFSTAINMLIKTVVKEKEKQVESYNENSMYKKYMDNLMDMRQMACEAGFGEMSLDEINQEIKLSREERRNILRATFG